MSVSKTFDNLTNNTNVALRHLLVSYGEKKNIYRKRKLIEKVVLTEKQEKEIKDYFKNNYGRSVPTDWHRLYQSYTGVYNVDYFPEILFSTELEPITNPYREAEMLDDKNLLPILFGNMGGGTSSYLNHILQ